MAATSPSPLVSSVEKTNGAKLSRLLIDGGTTVLRKIFDRYHPPANLLADLNANHHTLNNLLRRRVLHKPQWDLLFPPGGATPDSNTFDVTLLFLLLTNICGLSPPPSGWHTKPSASDTSVEANLARIKFFRNKLYGHVTTTGIDTPTFSPLWLEISAALVALGLPQAEIDRLKEEHCGEEDFIDVLFVWADTEEDIKSQLKAVRQTVDEVHSTQLEDRKILQDSIKRKLEEVHQEQTKIQQTADEVRQSQIKTHQTIDEVCQFQTKTQQTVDEIRQSQLRLQEVLQIDQKTHQVVANVRETQIDANKAIQEIRHSQHEFHKTLQETKSRVDEVQQTHEKLLGTQDQRFDRLHQYLKQTAEELEGQRNKHRENEILKKLAKMDTLKNVRHHADRYVEGTRLSIFSKVERWLGDRSSPNRVMVISGNAGMGKSVISAVMCEKMEKIKRLAGSHFCQHDRARHRNPKVMLQSLASQLCDFLPDYKKALVEKLSRNLGLEINSMEVKDLFELLFEEPLANLDAPGLTYLMVIDGLDESEFQGRNELLDVIANYFQSLPLWIRFLVTTRPERNIAKTLKNLHPLQLDPNIEENLKDIHLCFKEKLRKLLQSEHRENILQELVQKSEGVMLYAHYITDFIMKEVSFVTPELLDSTLPSGISSVYHSYFKRLETELCKELKITEGKFLNFLHALRAAREPLPLGFVSKLLLPVKSTSVTQEKVNAAIACVSALLPVRDECIHFFHKSVKDWLIEESEYKDAYLLGKGHEVLSVLCIDGLNEVKRKGVDGTQFSDTTKYALRHGVQHMLQVEDARVCTLEEVVTNFVLDLELVYAKLCVNVTAASEDIVCVQKHVDNEEHQRALNTLLVLLRKHLGTLEERPNAIFQTLLNEGSPELASESSHLLETKYSVMPYMEYLHKEDLQGRVQAKFQCSAAVLCFDVSPQLDYIVCECENGTIQLWSLHTGKQLWKRDSEVTKDYNWIYGPYRVLKPPAASYLLMSLYRSVVFYPLEDLVLPGILSHAYTFDGDLKPLFASSRCRFSVCSISADKTTILTNCTSDAKSIIMWSLTDGSEINRFTWSRDIASFALSLNERLLAISDLSGSIGLLDVMDGYRTLAQTTVSKVCGMIKFSPDGRCIYCLALNECSCNLFRFDVNMENDGNIFLDFLSEEVSNQPREFELCSDTGFLLGDPFCLQSERDTIHSRRTGLAFVLNEQSVLRVASGCPIIEMLKFGEVANVSAGVSKTTVVKVVLSLNGDTLFVIITTDGSSATLRGWDISRGMFKPGKRVFGDACRCDEYNLAPLRKGVVLQTNRDTLELWNFELSECIRSWTDLGYITEVIPISEVRVACEVKRDVESEVIIVDATTEGSLSTVTIDGEFVACNSKCHVITTDRRELQMQCGDVVFWKMSLPFLPSGRPQSTFSPTEQYCVLTDSEALYVLDVVLGEKLRTLQSRTHAHWFCAILDCKFVRDEECVTCFYGKLTGYFLQLFNVKSGDQLSEIAFESPVYSLAACPSERLIAIGFEDSKVNFKVLQVKFPGDKHNRKSKRSGFINKEQSYNTMTSTEPPKRF